MQDLELLSQTSKAKIVRLDTKVADEVLRNRAVPHCSVLLESAAVNRDLRMQPGTDSEF